jgi:hypothetical protein
MPDSGTAHFRERFPSPLNQLIGGAPMWDFITSENGTVTRRAGFSLAWLILALVAATVLSVVPARADCPPVGACFGIQCGTCVWMGCAGYPSGCPIGEYRQDYWCNLDFAAGGCQDLGDKCVTSC